MPFTQGGKPGPGKPRGSKHKKTQEWETLGRYVCEGGVKRYLKLLKMLPSADYMEHYEHVLEYFKPRLARIELPRQVEETAEPVVSAEHRAEQERALAEM
jgi:hypothetical protein